MEKALNNWRHKRINPPDCLIGPAQDAVVSHGLRWCSCFICVSNQWSNAQAARNCVYGMLFGIRLWQELQLLTTFVKRYNPARLFPLTPQASSDIQPVTVRCSPFTVSEKNHTYPQKRLTVPIKVCIDQEVFELISTLR